MKSSLKTIAHTVMPFATGRSHRKEAKEEGSQPGPSSSASGDLASRSSSRSERSSDAGETSARRRALLPGTSNASIGGGTPASPSRGEGSGGPMEGVSSSDLDDLTHHVMQSAIELAGDVVGVIEAANGKLPASPIPLPSIPTPASPSSATTAPPTQAPGAPDEPARMFASLAGKLEVRQADTSVTADHLAWLSRLREMVGSLTDAIDVRSLGTHERATHAQKRADYFDLMSDLIHEKAGQGQITMGRTDWLHLEKLSQHAEDLRTSAAHNPVADQDAHTHHTIRLTAREVEARDALEPLLHKHLPDLLSDIKDPDMLAQLANDMLRQSESRAHKPAGAAAPAEGSNGWRELVAPIRADIELAKAEIDLQRDLLKYLGGALEALGNAKIDGLKGGLNHLSRQLLPTKVAKKSGVDPRARSEQVRDSIHTHLRDHFYVGVSKENNKRELALAVKQSSVGLITIADLEAGLDKLLQLKSPKFIPLAIREAVKKTQGFELVEKDGQDHVSLTAKEQQHLNALRLDTVGGAKALPAQPSAGAPATHRTLHTLMAEFQHHIEHLTGLHASHGTERHQEALAQANNTLRALANLADMPPQQRLAQAATQAIQTAQFGVLKLSLINSFKDSITRDRVGEAVDQTLDLAHPHPGLTHEKTELLLDTWKKVMGSHSTQEMLGHLTDAEQKHDEIWRERGRPHGGQTAELLKDLRSAIERF